MYRIRYYDQSFHPDHFHRGLGVLGVAIVALNWLRWRLEVFVQLLVLRALSRIGGFPKDREDELRRTFKLDDDAEKLEKERTSPLHETSVEQPRPPFERAQRYQEGSISTSLDVAVAVDRGEETKMRPSKLDNLIAMYGPNLRAKKYGPGRRYLVGNPDGDFDPIEEQVSP